MEQCPYLFTAPAANNSLNCLQVERFGARYPNLHIHAISVDAVHLIGEGFQWWSPEALKVEEDAMMVKPC